MNLTIKKLKEAKEFIGTGICVDAVDDMITFLELEESIKEKHELANELLDA